MSGEHAVIRELLREPPFARLHELLRSLESAAVAYSGGVDSTFLLRVAHDALGERARGVLAFSSSLDRSEFEDAKDIATRVGLPITVVETHEFDNPEYRRNDSSRCYHCKTELFQVVRRWADREGYRWVLDGSHAGDADDFRPGLRARDEQRVRSPLMEAGLDKDAIRRYSRRLGLPTWDKPAAPCLSSRIPYGTEVTDERLRQVEAAERCLRDLGFRVVRVRHHGDVARIEVPASSLPELVAEDTRRRVADGVRRAGFRFVAIDIEGFRSGSLNRSLEEGELAHAPAGAPSPPLVQVETLGARRAPASGRSDA